MSVARRVIETIISDDNDTAIGADYIFDACQLLDISIGIIKAMRKAFSDSNTSQLNSLQVAAFKEALGVFKRTILKARIKSLPEAFDEESVSKLYRLKKDLVTANQLNYLSISDINSILTNSGSIDTSSLLYLRIVIQDEISQVKGRECRAADRALKTGLRMLGKIRAEGNPESPQPGPSSAADHQVLGETDENAVEEEPLDPRVESRKRDREEDPDSPQPGPSSGCKRSRNKRNIGPICIDSTDEDELTRLAKL